MAFGICCVVLKKTALVFIRAYQICIRGFLPPACRFFPSCSAYCHEAIAQKGLVKGGYLGLKRILKCHPWHPGGVDILENSDKNTH